MNAIKKYWYLMLLLIITIGLGVTVFLTSTKLSQTQPVAPTVPQATPKAVAPACTLTFSIASPTPTPGRPDICSSSTISASTIASGQPITVTITATKAVKKFSLAFYNLDNLYSANNPKPIFFTAGTQFVLHNDLATAATTSTFTITLADIDKADLNNGGTKPTHIQVNGYFQDETGQTSLPKPECVEQFSLAVVTNTPTEIPSSSPTATSSPTSSPTATETPPPGTTETPTPTSPPNASPTQPPLAQASPTPPPTPKVPVSGIGPTAIGLSVMGLGSLLVLLGLVL